MPARHTAHGQPWAGVWSDLAVLGMARQSPVGHCGFQQTHSRHSWRLQSGAAWLCKARQGSARQCRHTASVRGCGSLRGSAGRVMAGQGRAWFGLARQGKHAAHLRVRGSLQDDAWHGAALRCNAPHAAHSRECAEVEFRKAGQFVAVLGPAWLVSAMQTHSGQRWPLQSAVQWMAWRGPAWRRNACPSVAKTSG
jgi:hypothetical protein